MNLSVVVYQLLECSMFVDNLVGIQFLGIPVWKQKAMKIKDLERPDESDFKSVFEEPDDNSQPTLCNIISLFSKWIFLLLLLVVIVFQGEMSQKNPLTRRNLTDALLEGVKKQTNSADTLKKLEQQLKNAKDETTLTNFFEEFELCESELQKHLAQKLTSDYDLPTVISEICIKKQPVNLIETINDLITQNKLIQQTLIIPIQGKERDIKGQITKVKKDGHKIVLKLEDFEEVNYDITLVSNQQYIVTIEINFQEEIQLLTWIGEICDQGKKRIVLEEDRMIRVDQDSHSSLIGTLPSGKYKVMMFFQDEKVQKIIFTSDSSKIHEFVIDPDTQKGVTIKSDWVEKHIQYQQFKNQVKTIQPITHHIQCKSPEESNNSFRIVKVQENQKQLDRMKILQKINRLKMQITEQLKKADLSPILMSLLGLLVSSDDFSKQKTQLEGIFIKKAFESINDRFESIKRCYFKLKQPTSVQLILKQILIDTNYSLLVKEKGAINAVRIMGLLAKSEKSNQLFKGKDIISFYGATGSGKSTCVNYFMGVPLVEKQGRFAGTIVQRNEEKFKNLQCNIQTPQIGHKIGTSETFYSQAYEFIESKSKSFGEQLRNVVLCDNPGFDDTRGIEYEICAGMSFDTAIRNCSNIRSIVLVISYASFTTDRCNLVFRQLGDLEERFPDLLKQQTPTNKSFHILITKQKNKDQIQSFQARLKSHIIEQKNRGQEVSDQNGKSRLAIYKILLRMFQGNRIQFIYLGNNMKKNVVLQSYLTSGNVPKSSYKRFMENSSLKKDFNDHLSTSAHTLTTLILSDLRTVLPESIQQCKTTMLKLEQDIKCRQHQIIKLNGLQKASSEMIIKYEEIFENLQVLQVQQRNIRMSVLVQQSTKLLNKQIQKLKEIDKTKQKQCLQHEDIIQFLIEIREKLQRNNTALKQKIEQLKAGTKREEIYSCCPTLGSKKRLGLDHRKQEAQRAWDDIEALPPSVLRKQWVVGSSDQGYYVQPVISREYSIAPNKDFDPDSYIQAYSKSLSYHCSNYKATIESQHAKLVKIKTSTDRRKIIFYAQFYSKKCSKQQDLPYLRIIHQIPNEVANSAEILNKQSELEAGEREMKRLVEQIQSRGKQLTFTAKQRQMLRNVIQGNNRGMIPSTPQKVLIEKEVQYKEYINDIISKYKKNNKELQQNIRDQKDKEESYRFKHRRIAYLIKDQMSKQIPQSVLKFVKQAMDNLPKEQEQRNKMDQCTQDRIKNFQEFISNFEGKEDSLKEDIERILQTKQVIGIGNDPKHDMEKGNDRDDKGREGMVLRKEEELAI